MIIIFIIFHRLPVSTELPNSHSNWIKQILDNPSIKKYYQDFYGISITLFWFLTSGIPWYWVFYTVENTGLWLKWLTFTWMKTASNSRKFLINLSPNGPENGSTRKDLPLWIASGTKNETIENCFKIQTSQYVFKWIAYGNDLKIGNPFLLKGLNSQIF